MNVKGFFIKRLDFVGKNIRSSIHLKKGLNVIYGPTSTGKTFMFESINFMLGGKDSPQAIEEIKDFDKIQMEIETYKGKSFTLERNISGGGFKKFESDLSSINHNSKYEKLGSTNKAKKSLSKFLLSLSGFENKVYHVKRNNKNELNKFSFRSMIHLIMVDEVRIISKNSPVYSGVNQSKTMEQSILKLLLTNKDDSALQSEDNSKLDDTYNKVKMDLIRNMIEESKDELQKMKEKVKRYGDPSEDIKALSSLKDLVINDLNELVHERNESWSKTQSYIKKEQSIRNLLKRFSLLENQYNSDLERLLFLSEGSHYFNQLNLERCPVCHQEFTNGIESHEEHILKVEDKVEGVKAEIIKITTHKKDLEKTIESVTAELKEVENKIQIETENHRNINEHIEKELQPNLDSITKEIDDILIKQTEYNNIKFLKDNIQKLEARKESIETAEGTKEIEYNEENQLNKYLDELCVEIENILSGWDVDGHSISFDYETYDILIGGKKRTLFGKGYRAIAFSAFILGLMKYCINNKLPHAGLTILDSPLTTYKKEDNPEDKVPEDIQNKFYDELSKLDYQTIIFENKKPQQEVIENINFIEFTKNSSIGRYGFIIN
ncbi:hypothetical protein [Sutcliffiella cohnii]|uniref:hypothetical protein n=1 Tax=Sutcliffiella cohnii TaxID=33932 RepID=UPI002E1B4A6C|nr:hypothetical protein [Sutcliffiella cohnii]